MSAVSTGGTAAQRSARWCPRMVASDLDGTLVRADGRVSARTVDVIRRCREAGVEFVAVTGRPPRWLAGADGLAEAVGSGLAVCANGALVWDLARHEVVVAHLFAREDVMAAAAAMIGAVPGAVVAVETLQGFRRTPEYVPRFDAAVVAPVAPLAELLADDPGVVKLLVRCEGMDSDDVVATARAVLGGIGLPTHSGARHGLIEVSAAGISKAGTLAELAADRGVEAADVVAFGDMPNDLAMLCWAGRGYAMASGHPDVIAAVPGLAPACEEDGVAQVLEGLLTAPAR